VLSFVLHKMDALAKDGAQMDDVQVQLLLSSKQCAYAMLAPYVPGQDVLALVPAQWREDVEHAIFHIQSRMVQHCTSTASAILFVQSISQNCPVDKRDQVAEYCHAALCRDIVYTVPPPISSLTCVEGRCAHPTHDVLQVPAVVCDWCADHPGVHAGLRVTRRTKGAYTTFTQPDNVPTLLCSMMLMIISLC
jgi:hypothetical protein